jgi:hypothetical protein
MPRKIRHLIADLQRAGFVQDGDDAQHYQEKQVRNAIKSINE